MGDHNYYNIAPVLLVCNILNLDLEKVSDLIDTFKPLEHRLEYVGNYNGIDFYNDSISTIPMAAINCINAVKNPYTIIIGGLDRGLDYKPLIDFLYDTEKIKTIICLPDTGYKICEELINIGCTKKIIEVENMKEAVKEAYLNTLKGYACMLSPAAASYNTYKNFEMRGLDYKKEIEIQKKVG